MKNDKSMKILQSILVHDKSRYDKSKKQRAEINSSEVRPSSIRGSTISAGGGMRKTTGEQVIDNSLKNQIVKAQTMASTKLPNMSIELKRRAESSILYHSAKIQKTLTLLEQHYELLLYEERHATDVDIKARIDNERLELQELVQDVIN